MGEPDKPLRPSGKSKPKGQVPKDDTSTQPPLQAQGSGGGAGESSETSSVRADGQRQLRKTARKGLFNFPLEESSEEWVNEEYIKEESQTKTKRWFFSASIVVVVGLAVWLAAIKATTAREHLVLDTVQQLDRGATESGLRFGVRLALRNVSDDPATVTSIAIAFRLQQDDLVSRYLTTVDDGQVLTTVDRDDSQRRDTAVGSVRLDGDLLRVDSPVVVQVSPKGFANIVLGVDLPREEVPAGRSITLHNVDFVIRCKPGPDIASALGSESLPVKLIVADAPQPAPPAAPRPVASAGKCWEGDKWKEARQNIDWVMWQDSGALRRYQVVRGDGKSILDALMAAQEGASDGRVNARRTIRELGEVCVEEYVRTVFPDRASPQ